MITLDVEGIDELTKALGGAAKRLPRELTIAVNATAKKVATNMSKQVRGELVVKAADLKKVLRVKSRANKGNITAVVQLDEKRRLTLKSFGARQIRSGVSYKISKSSGRKTVPGGFMGPRPGVKAAKLRGHAFKRTGSARYPIVLLHGVSPWGVYTRRGMLPQTIQDGVRELNKQIARRIRFNVLKRERLI